MQNLLLKVMHISPLKNSHMKKYFILILFISLSYFVNAQNPPDSQDETVTTNEDNDYVFATGDFNYTDAPEADPFDHVNVSTTVLAGTLFNDANGNAARCCAVC